MWLKFHFDAIVSLTPTLPKVPCSRCSSIPSCVLYVRIIVDLIFGEDYKMAIFLTAEFSSSICYFNDDSRLYRAREVQLGSSGTQASCQWQQRCHAGCCRPWGVVFKPWVSPRYLVAWLRTDFSREALRPFLTTWD